MQTQNLKMMESVIVIAVYYYSIRLKPKNVISKTPRFGEGKIFRV